MPPIPIVIPYFNYSGNVARLEALHRCLRTLKDDRFQVFLSTVDVDVRHELSKVALTLPDHVYLIPSTGGDVVWQKPFALNRGIAVALEQSTSDTIYVADSDALFTRENLDQIVGCLEDIPVLDTDGSLLVKVHQPFRQFNYNGEDRFPALYWEAMGHLEETRETSMYMGSYSTQYFSQTPQGGFLGFNRLAARIFRYSTACVVGGDDSLMLSTLVGYSLGQWAAFDSHVRDRIFSSLALDMAPGFWQDQFFHDLSDIPGDDIQFMMITAKPEHEAEGRTLRFQQHGDWKQTTYTSRHEMTRQVLPTYLEQVDSLTPTRWSEDAPESLKNQVAEYLRRI